MAVLAFLTAALYCPGIAGAATSPRWALLAVAAPFLLRGKQEITAGHQALAVFLIWAALTMFWNPVPMDGVGGLFILGILACCFCLGAQTIDMRSVYIGASLGLSLSSIVSIIQFYGFAILPTITPVSGLYANGNFMGEAAALLLVAVIAERIWWLVLLLAPALFLSGGRGAMLAFAVAIVVHFRHRWRAMVVPVAVAAAAILIVTLDKGVGAGLSERFLFWQSTMNGVGWFGHGIGSFWSVYPAFDLRISPLTMPEQAHNEFLTVAFELGLVGLAILGVFCLTLIGPLDTSRLVLIALLVESCFGFPVHASTATTGFLGMVVAGHAVRSRYLLRVFVMHRRIFGPAGLARARFRYRHGNSGFGSEGHAV